MNSSNISMTTNDTNHQDFDVFLCHNHEDKKIVREIAFKLKDKGINPWLDVWELPPGQPWQEILEQQIEKIHSVAVFIGKKGIGPWQNREIYAFIQQFVKRHCPVIPVILPACKGNPAIPVFLNAMTHVDFRESDPEPLAQLIWGIKGSKIIEPPVSKPKKYLTIIIGIIICICLIYAGFQYISKKNDDPISKEYNQISKGIAYLHVGDIQSAKMTLDRQTLRNHLYDMGIAKIFIFDDKIDQVQTLLNQWPDNESKPLKSILNGDISLLQLDIITARKHYQNVLKNRAIGDREKAMANFGMGQIHLFNHSFQDAIQSFDRVTDAIPEFVMAYTGKGLAYENMEDFVLASDYYKKSKTLIEDKSTHYSANPLYPINSLLMDSIHPIVNWIRFKKPSPELETMIHSPVDLSTKTASPTIFIYDMDFNQWMSGKVGWNQYLAKTLESEICKCLKVHCIKPLEIFKLLKRLDRRYVTIKDLEKAQDIGQRYFGARFYIKGFVEGNVSHRSRKLVVDIYDMNHKTQKRLSELTIENSVHLKLFSQKIVEYVIKQ